MRFTRLVIPAALLDEVIAHARAELPAECCGLLAGTVADGTGTATHRFAVGNDAASGTEYLTNARDMLAASKAMRSAGVTELAIYHSHPTAAAVPSRRDVERNTYGETVVHLIVGFVGGAADVRGWWLTADGYRPAEVVAG
jgi:proteasome lid subunit RPN8/RPN11